MSTITLQEAQSNLAQLVHRLAPGEGVTITENDRPVARLIVPLVAPTHPLRPRPPVTGVPKAGNCQGLFVVPDDFKEPLDELREYIGMSLLLDTCALLWFLSNDPKLSAPARAAIEEAANVRWISPGSLFEIAIKVRIGKLTLAAPFATIFPTKLSAADIHLLPLEPIHIEPLTTLPLHHKDPFDRLIAATALVENLTLVSSDAAFDAYGVSRLW